jgi:hypothetical protein
MVVRAMMEGWPYLGHMTNIFFIQVSSSLIKEHGLRMEMLLSTLRQGSAQASVARVVGEAGCTDIAASHSHSGIFFSDGGTWTQNRNVSISAMPGTGAGWIDRIFTLALLNHVYLHRCIQA